MKGLMLTKHFEQRWFERVGNKPTIAAVRHFIRHSIPVQAGEDVTRADGTPFRILAIYWHPELDLVIKIDSKNKTAVTVLTRENWGRRRDDGTTVMESCETPNLVPPARIERIKALFGKRSVFA